MANTIKIKATFHEDCVVIDASGKIRTSGIDYEYAKKHTETEGGTIWQVFIDEDGYVGMVRRPYDCSRKDD